MQANNVVYMGSVRDLLSELDKLRSDILAGEVEGWGGSVKFTDGREVTYLGGTFKGNSAERARAMLRVSAARVLHEEETIPPLPHKRRTH
jgi:hypothetical protein